MWVGYKYRKLFVYIFYVWPLVVYLFSMIEVILILVNNFFTQFTKLVMSENYECRHISFSGYTFLKNAGGQQNDDLMDAFFG